MMIIWTRVVGQETVTLPQGVTRVTDKYGFPKSYGTTLTISGAPVYLNPSANFNFVFLPTVLR